MCLSHKPGRFLVHHAGILYVQTRKRKQANVVPLLWFASIFFIEMFLSMIMWHVFKHLSNALYFLFDGKMLYFNCILLFFLYQSIIGGLQIKLTWPGFSKNHTVIEITAQQRVCLNLKKQRKQGKPQRKFDP